MARILIVDDEPLNQELASLFCQLAGHTVALAGHGLEAMEALEREAFDLILLDNQMPVMNGASLARRLRAHERLKAIPIIGITALPEHDHAELRAAGMNTVLSKPLKRPMLMAAINEYLL